MFQTASVTSAMIVFGMVFAAGLSLVSSEADLSHGLGNNIKWHTLNEGLALAKAEQKPLALIVHKSWCGACAALRPKVAESMVMAEESKNFVMVNTEDKDEPSEEKYRPDGGYVPRILFFNPDGTLLQDVVNADGNPKYKYYYYEVPSIIKSMKEVSAKMARGQNQNVPDDTSSGKNSENAFDDSFDSDDYITEKADSEKIEL